MDDYLELEYMRICKRAEHVFPERGKYFKVKALDMLHKARKKKGWDRLYFSKRDEYDELFGEYITMPLNELLKVVENENSKCKRPYRRTS